MTSLVHGRPVPKRPDVRALRDREVRSLCWRGELPAECLNPRDREHLVYELWLAGWTDVEIATHARMTTYTTARIRDRLGIEPRRERKASA